MTTSNNTRIVAFRPALVQLLGSLPAAVMASQMLYWHGKGLGDSIERTREQIAIETGLSVDMQRGAEAVLKRLQIVDVSKRGIPARNHYAIDWQKLRSITGAVANQPSVVEESYDQSQAIPTNSHQETPPPVVGKPGDQSSENPATSGGDSPPPVVAKPDDSYKEVRVKAEEEHSSSPPATARAIIVHLQAQGVYLANISKTQGQAAAWAKQGVDLATLGEAIAGVRALPKPPNLVTVGWIDIQLAKMREAKRRCGTAYTQTPEQANEANRNAVMDVLRRKVESGMQAHEPMPIVQMPKTGTPEWWAMQDAVGWEL